MDNSRVFLKLIPNQEIEKCQLGPAWNGGGGAVWGKPLPEMMPGPCPKTQGLRASMRLPMGHSSRILRRDASEMIKEEDEGEGGTEREEEKSKTGLM